MESATSSAKVNFDESLASNVIKTGKCVSCGACVLVCPFRCIDYSEGAPALVKECEACGICPKTCPQYGDLLLDLEKTTLGRERSVEEKFGVHRLLTIAQANDIRILNVSQDGGIVTALLLFALESGLIDGAIVSGVNREKPHFPVPKLAMTGQEILEAAGTRYFYSPNVLALADAIKQKKEKIAFVGTPCQIRAIRKMQAAGLKKYVGFVKYLIGLMCSESFTYEGLIEKHVKQLMKIEPSSIRKMNIKGKIILNTTSGIREIPLAEAKQYARSNCKVCEDFSSELADISVGGLGLENWTFVIIRTERGEELFNKALEAGVLKTRPVEKSEFALSLLVKLSAKKRKPSSQ